MGKRVTPALAKLTPPRLRNAVDRDRLFDELDDTRYCPFTWISAPPGAGKTTLIAAYLRARGYRTSWLQLDAADSDPATFFYYLRHAVMAIARSRAQAPPLFTPEYRADLTTFTRQFLRAAIRNIAGEALLVLDNFQEIEGDSPICAALAACLDEIPEQLRGIVISRTDPPPAFARARVNGLIARIGWESLQLSRQETAAIAMTKGIRDPHAISAMHKHTCGWMAGVVLMAESMSKNSGISGIDDTPPMDTLFDYFAGQVFDTLPPATRDVAIAASLMPHVTASGASAVTDTDDAIKHVDYLYRRRLFTDRTTGKSPTYRFHALFSTFLRARSLVRFSADERTLLLRRAAKSFQESGDVENAFPLYIEGQDPQNATPIFIGHAPGLIAQGRWRTLVEWHTMLRESHAASDPWIAFWLGRALSPVDPLEARRHLELSFVAFSLAQERRGQLLAAVGVLETIYFQYDELRPMDEWIDKVGVQLDTYLPTLTDEEELWVHAVFLVGCCYRRPGHCLLARSAAQVEALLPRQTDVNLKVTAASMLHHYAYTALDAHAAALAIREARPSIGSDQLTAQRAALYLAEEGYCHYAFVRYREALACYAEAAVIARQHELRDVEVRFSQWRGFCERRAGMLTEAKETVGRLESLPHPRRGMRGALLATLRAYVAFDDGDVERALLLSIPAQGIGVDAGQCASMTLMHIINAGMLIEAGQFDRAHEFLDFASNVAGGTILEYLLGPISMMRALLAIRRGALDSARRLTAATLMLSRKDRELYAIRWYRAVLSEVVSFALEHGIDGLQAERLIREHGLLPVNYLSGSWPWSVKIHTLGRFEVLVEGAAPSFSRKAPHRVLLLLKMLVAFGGTEVPEHRLVDALWPDLDGDAAYKALAALVHRLRALLRCTEAIHYRDGTLSLDLKKCWVDVFALQQRARSPAPQRFEVVLELYKGCFLPNEDESWSLPLREKARTWFTALTRRNSEAPESTEELQQAAERYTAAIDVDEQLEPLYFALIDCYERLAQHGDAAEATKRLERARLRWSSRETGVRRTPARTMRADGPNL